MTLTTLDISYCNLHFYSPAEERAVDAAIPLLLSLEDLAVSGDIVSSLAISRKPALAGRLVNTGKFYAESVPNLSWDGLVEALEVCRWKSVKIERDEDMANNPIMQERAMEISRRRNIEFSIYTLWSLFD